MNIRYHVLTRLIDEKAISGDLNNMGYSSDSDLVLKLGNAKADYLVKGIMMNKITIIMVQ